VRRNGGVEVARQRAMELTGQAEAQLDHVPGGASRDALCDCLAYVVDRRS
jgi:hypothetical protein